MSGFILGVYMGVQYLAWKVMAITAANRRACTDECLVHLHDGDRLPRYSRGSN